MNDEHDELASELHTILGRALPEAWSDERLERIAESAMAGAETYEAGQLPEIETLLGALPESWSEERLAKIADAAIARAEEARVGDLLRAAAPPAWDEARVERIAERVMGRTTSPEERPQTATRAPKPQQLRRRVAVGLLAMAACLALVWFARRSPMTPDRPIASQQTSPAQMRCGELRLPSDIEVLCLEAGTVLRVTEMRAEAVSVTLDRGGSARFNVHQGDASRQTFDVMAGGIRIRHVGTEFTVTWRDRDDVVVVTVHEGSVRIGDGPRARLLEATRAASFTIVERLAMERETPPPAPAVDLLRCMHEAQDAERANSINESIGILQACGRGVQAGMPLGAVLFLRLGALLEANHNREGARIAYVRAKELAQNRDEEQSAETAIRRMNSQGQH